MKAMVKNISIEKEGNDYTLYIDELQCGTGRLEDLLDVLVEKQENLAEYAKEAQIFY